MFGIIPYVVWLFVCGVFVMVNTYDPPGERPSSVGTFTTKPSSSSLKNYQGVTKHPYINLYYNHTAYKGKFNDQYWYYQWYAQDYRKEDMPVMDLNLVPVYKKEITGKGVVIALVGGGIDTSHPDLKRNYMRHLSYDVCNENDNVEPFPVSEDDQGTKAAAAIAMEQDNKECGVGAAFNANFTVIRFNIDDCVISKKAKALEYKPNDIHIYSIHAGRGLYEFSPFHNALKEGMKNGRNKKGSIYVTSTYACVGNLFMNHNTVIGVNGASQEGKVLGYGDKCAAYFATTYLTDPARMNQGMLTINQYGKCVMEANGNMWAPRAYASAIIALILEANPNLKTRDVMHIITMGAEVAPLADNVNTWKKNKAGFWVSINFGFGLMNAENMVNLALQWTNVPDRVPACVIHYNTPTQVTQTEVEVKLNIDTDNCKIKYVENVHLKATISYAPKGNVVIVLSSPKGTDVTLLDSRAKDMEVNGKFSEFFKSLHTWGEDPRGTWTVRLRAEGKEDTDTQHQVEKLSFVVSGTELQPEHYKKGPRTYSGFRLNENISSE